jgi:putative phosphoesterase
VCIESVVQLAIVSDTHIPTREEEIPESFRDRIAEADHVVHAGDFGSHAALADVRERSTDLTAVYGNADPVDVDLPAVASVTVEGVTVVVSHGMVDFVERAVSSSEGVVFGREDWRDAVAETARARAGTDRVVGVAGHSHELEDQIHDGVRVLNPGSVTGVGPAEGRPTMLTATVSGGDLDVTVRET